VEGALVKQRAELLEGDGVLRAGSIKEEWSVFVTKKSDY